MIEMACREKHVYAYSPAESIDVKNTANALKRLYDMQGYDTRIDISTVTIIVTATRILGVKTDMRGEEDGSRDD